MKSEHTKKTSLKSTVSNTIQKPSSRKPSGCGWILVISAVIAVYASFFSGSSNDSSKHDEAVFNSEWDSSVSQVVDYLKNVYLNDPDSYKSISWSAVVKLNDTKETGFACYQVRHRYRAKNGFGGYATEEKVFKLDYQGNIVEVKDWLH